MLSWWNVSTIERHAVLAKLVHLAQTVPAELTISHVNHKVPVSLAVMKSRVTAIATSTGRERVDVPLGKKGDASADPWVIRI